MISETKTGDTFPDNQFSIEGFSTPYRLDLGSNNGGIYLYAWEDISSILIAIENKPIERFSAEAKLRNDNWLISCSS